MSTNNLAEANPLWIWEQPHTWAACWILRHLLYQTCDWVPMSHYWWQSLVRLPCATFFTKKEMVWCLYLRGKACFPTLITGKILGCHGFFNDDMVQPKTSVECWTRLIKGANLSWMVLIGVITGVGLQTTTVSLILLLFYFTSKKYLTWIWLLWWIGRVRGVGFWETRLTTVGVRPLRGDLVCGHSGWGG